MENKEGGQYEDTMKGRKLRTGLKKETTVQDATKRGKLRKTEARVSPCLKVADTRSRRGSGTQSPYPTLHSSPCPRARQEKQENPPLGEWEWQRLGGGTWWCLWQLATPRTMVSSGQSSVYLLSHSKTDPEPPSGKTDAAFSEFKREFQFQRCVRFMKYLNRANTMEEQ